MDAKTRRAWGVSAALHALTIGTVMLLVGGPPAARETMEVEDGPIEVHVYAASGGRQPPVVPPQIATVMEADVNVAPPVVPSPIIQTSTVTGPCGAGVPPALEPDAGGTPASQPKPQQPSSVSHALRGTTSADAPRSPSAGFFGIRPRGDSVVYVLDRSASMGAFGRLDLARRELAASLRVLPADARFQVIAYHRSAEAAFAGRGPQPATADAAEFAAHWFADRPAEGGNDHRRAVNLALGSDATTIYLLTDAEELTTADAYGLARANRARAAIHVIVVGRPRERFREAARLLAQLNRGEYREVSPP